MTGLNRLIGVYIALLGLLAATWAISFIDIGTGNFVANLGIAAVKTGIVVHFFMRISSAPLARSAALVGLFCLITLYWLTANDYVDRRSPAPPASIRDASTGDVASPGTAGPPSNGETAGDAADGSPSIPGEGDRREQRQ